ncbi:unnamed protein product [Lymnaea stagnalis]|uniref:ENTH domain-containing protein n=1 Tax=Lymnaea stagnalis TaxID=6523 RepID=A0AAV2H6H9_LYMST
MSSTTQRLSFVNKISLILKATSDDENQTPGYMYKEIMDITFDPIGYSDSLIEFLVDRLKSKSCHVKFKVLKLMKHLLDDGSKDFQTGLRRHSDTVKEYTKYGGPPHPMHGNVPYLSIRKLAKEVCETLYSQEYINAKSPSDATGSDRPAEFKYGGLGPVRTGGAIQGFGNTPSNQPKGIGETILDGIEKFGAKISETAADRQAALLAKLDLGSSVSNYQPPVVMCGQGESHLLLSPEENTTSVITKSTFRSVKKHEPGKAGGGWGDDEDDETDCGDDFKVNDNSSKQQSMDTDSLLDPSMRLQPEADWQEESDFVACVLRQGSTGAGQAYLSPSDVTAFLTRCSSLSCDAVLNILVSKLASRDVGVVIRTLQLLEGMIYNKEELISIDCLTALCKEALVACLTSSQAVSQTVIATPGEGGGKQVANNNLWLSAQTKLTKVILTLQQLSSHKEILPTDKLKDLTIIRV